MSYAKSVKAGRKEKLFLRAVIYFPVSIEEQMEGKLSRKEQGRVHGISRSPSSFLLTEKRGYGLTHGPTDGPTDGHTLL